MNRVEDLEAAILKRAEKLAAEYQERAERRKTNMLKEASEKLRLHEEHEMSIAKAQGDLIYLRKVQASELRLRAHMDHLRWGLVQEMEHRLEDRMRAFAEQEDEYLNTIKGYLAQGAKAIERDDLIAEVNHRDHQRLVERWDSFVQEAAPGKNIILASDPIETIGGILIRSQDGRIRLNNTFEGRRERLRSRLHQIIVERLMPATVDSGGVS
jgi:V/A-type H+-transporting ATPase subunit E